VVLVRGAVEEEAKVQSEARSIEPEADDGSPRSAHTPPVIVEEQALEELYRQRSAPVVRYCRLMLGDGWEAQDVLQDVFIRVIRYGGSVRSRKLPLSWLYRTAARCCYDRLRLRARVVSLPETAIEALPSYPSAMRTDFAGQLDRLVHALRPDLRQLFVLYYVEGMRQDKLARRLGCSRRTVGRRIKRLRRAIRRVSSTI
jgi:RNA polymerase sigma factor (sigma-70 family)